MSTPTRVRAAATPASRCPVCLRAVAPDADGTVRVVGLAPREAPRVWVWGPAVVHDECRYDVRTPLDDRTGYLPVEQRVRTTLP